MGMVLFTSLGLSGFGFAVVSRISPYRNLFIVLTIIMLGLAHNFIARNSNVSKNTRTIVWIMTIVSVGLIVYPSLFRG
jgi:mercuric ion transport protein